MKYRDIKEARFISRPNRFIAQVLIEGTEETVHVKNTGRCRELLTPGARVFLQHSDSPRRKTAYDLVAVYKGDKLINMDSYAPNIVFGEYLREGGLGFVPDCVKAECVHGDSRFDFYFEYQGRKCFCEVKGVTLENEGIVSFPDAPTIRGAKHLRGLKAALNEGYEAMAVFIIQMEDVSLFRPNYATDPDFCRALIEAESAGVKILALSCRVERDSLRVAEPVPYELIPPGGLK